MSSLPAQHLLWLCQQQVCFRPTVVCTNMTSLHWCQRCWCWRPHMNPTSGLQGFQRRHHICTTSHPHKVPECHIWGWTDSTEDKAKGKLWATINLPESPALSGSLGTDILIEVALSENKSEQWKESGSYIYRPLSRLADHRPTKHTKNGSVTICRISLWVIRFPRASAWMTPSAEEGSCIGGQKKKIK